MLRLIPRCLNVPRFIIGGVCGPPKAYRSAPDGPRSRQKDLERTERPARLEAGLPPGVIGSVSERRRLRRGPPFWLLQMQK